MRTRDRRAPSRVALSASMLLLPLLMLTGCTAAVSARTSSPSAGGAGLGAADLDGTWRVTGAGVRPSTWIRFSRGGFRIDRGGHGIEGEWDGDAGRLVAAIESWDGAAGNPASPWLTGARAFAMDGGGRTLISAGGSVLATLRADPDPGRSVTEVLVPVPDLPSTSADPSPHPPAGAVSDASAITGSWVTGTGPDRAHTPSLLFDADGSYTWSDGCNGNIGAWQLAPGGRLLRTVGFNGDVGCSNLVPVDRWMADARSVGIADDRLTLYDDAGHAVGSLTRG